MRSRNRRPPRTRQQFPKRRAVGRTRGRWRGLVRFSVGVLVLFVVVWAVYTLWLGRPAREKRPTPAAAPGGPASPQVDVTLYFSDDQAEYLVGESRTISRRNVASAQAQALVEELMRGPRTGLQPTVPHGTQLRKGTVDDQGLCTLDLSEEFVENHPGGASAEIATVYSIVETLAVNIPAIRAVQLLVEGKPRETLAGHLFIGSPLQPEPRFIRPQRSTAEGSAHPPT
jgi:spore germination protein GerM